MIDNMIDNFFQIRKILKFEFVDEYYFCQIFQRRKDLPSLKTNNRLVKTYYIDSLKKYDEISQEIETLCYYLHARAYINLNRRSFRKTALEMNVNMAKTLQSGDHRAIRSLMAAYERSAEKGSIEKEKKWVIDVDTKDPKEIQLIREIILDCDYGKTKKPKILHEIPTLNGVHLITQPFHVLQFQNLIEEAGLQGKYKTEETIKKNNHTCLFIPDWTME